MKGDIENTMDDKQTEEFNETVAAIAERIDRPHDEANIAAWLSDGEYVNDVEALAHDYMAVLRDRIADKLTDDDIAAWHDGEITEHAQEIIDQFGTFQVWGSRTGSETLTIVYPA